MGTRLQSDSDIMALQMRDLLLAVLLIGILGYSDSFSVLEADSKCYTCNSHEGECSADQFGIETDCAGGFGCLISLETKPGAEDFFVRECLAMAEDEYKCETETTEDGMTVHACQCAGELCNKNWVEAGSTENPDGPTDAPTDPSHQPIKCYRCDSNENGCSDEESGEVNECVDGYGCLISKETKPDGDFFLRDCVVMPDINYECETINTGEGTSVHTCSCATELCNKNWADAGSTEQPDGPTNAPTEPAVKTVKCYSCDSNSDSGSCDDENYGTETDCEVERGCNIMSNKDLYTRGCSVEEEPVCKEEADTRSCNCLTALCNANWKTAGAEDKIKCYSCDSNEGECDDAHAGTEIDCAVEAGCSISTDVSDGKTLFVRGCSGEVEPTPGCTNEGDATTCFCMNALCNFDWNSAGSTTDSSDTTKPTESTTQGPTLHCYKCDSTAGDCTEEARGKDVECPEAEGCTIRKTTGTDGDGVLMRDCSTEKDALCDTINNGDGKGTTQFCNCDTSLCNGDWSSAGSTEVPPPVTTTAGTPAAETTAPTDAPTDAPGAANRMSSALAIASGLGAALVLSIL